MQTSSFYSWLQVIKFHLLCWPAGHQDFSYPSGMAKLCKIYFIPYGQVIEDLEIFLRLQMKISVWHNKMQKTLWLKKVLSVCFHRSKQNKSLTFAHTKPKFKHLNIHPHLPLRIVQLLHYHHRLFNLTLLTSPCVFNIIPIQSNNNRGVYNGLQVLVWRRED